MGTSINFLEIGRAIWTIMQQLEALEIDVAIDSPENNFTALDSCFTGISVYECQRLHNVMQTKIWREKWGKIPTEIPKSELMAEREFPSILNMKRKLF